MEIPGLGVVTQHCEFLRSEPIPSPLLGGQLCRIIVAGYVDDVNKEEFHEAINNFLSGDASVLKACEQKVYDYYKLVNDGCWEPDDDEYITIESPSGVWDYIQLGSMMVERCAYGDKGVYVSLESECEWEPEHGLMIVFKNGLKVTKVGGYDGNLI
jgi:hypothetical protein